jgi:hypothetical protein
VQIVEAFHSREPLGLNHALHERFPRDDRFNSGERIGPALSGLEQSFTNAPIEPNFLVNGLARLLEFLGVAAFGTVEKSSDRPITSSAIVSETRDSL